MGVSLAGDRAILPLLGRRAARITTVSGLSREHLVHYGVAPRSKIVVTHNGSDHTQAWSAARSRLTERPSRPFVMCLGRPQKYKNVELMLALAPALDRLGLDLWMAGDIDSSALQKAHGQLPANVRLLGRISDDGLRAGLGASRLLPLSLAHRRVWTAGCGSHGARLSGRASTSPCLPEVCGDSALFADPDDLDGWIQAIAKLKEDGALRKVMVAKGRARAASYSWRSPSRSVIWN